MTMNGGYDAYAKNKILTASPAELTLMLYEGAIKFTNVGIVAIEKKDMVKANINIQKAERIIAELRGTLDMKYEVAKDFDNVYEYIGWCLLQGNVKKDIEKLEEALKHMRTMRDTWKEVMDLNKQQGNVS
ncbi:MAG: flagellar export chaperone FliS [Lachnospiraceae bacterium]|nr:flagellar export chaperone FliS [Lachnospiraceae bacterium]